MDYDQICRRLMTANNKTTHHIAIKAMVKYGEYNPKKRGKNGQNKPNA
tara:strand:- start:239 stop:382 length:144 start_codon:yes stop_codon:yes gene_type:complete